MRSLWLNRRARPIITELKTNKISCRHFILLCRNLYSGCRCANSFTKVNNSRGKVVRLSCSYENFLKASACINRILHSAPNVGRGKKCQEPTKLPLAQPSCCLLLTLPPIVSIQRLSLSLSPSPLAIAPEKMPN